MDIFIEHCIDIINIKKNNENKENKSIKVVFQLGPDKQNEYNLYQFKRLEF